MEVLRTILEMRERINAYKVEGKSIGLVPTMGFLHEGHLSLIRRCREENDICVVSIFVNPKQFAQGDDFNSYPKDSFGDFAACEQAGVDIIFYPDVDDMYQNHKTYINVEGLSQQLCGKSRPTHFQGVCTVVAKLFNISKADAAYFGEKDAQQLTVLKKMVEDLNFDIRIVACPTVRESDGLAKSSRNKYLSAEERLKADCLYRALHKAETMCEFGAESTAIIAEMTKIIEENPEARIDYIQIVDTVNLQPVEEIREDILIALAVELSGARLIDNITVKIKP